MKEIIENSPDKYILTYEKFLHFIENAPNAKDKQSFANEYTDDIPKLIEMLQDLYKYLNDGKAKNRFTRLINKLTINNTPQNDIHLMEL